jgi:catechol 2,3-dioxygenase-like lactoylglutathione lyase family enzyme
VERALNLALGQLAFAHLGGAMRRWYRDGLGLLPSGASMFAGPPAEKVNGLPFPIFPARWLMDGREWVQIELFRFIRPRPRPRRPDETPADQGYRRAGFQVEDFDRTLAALAGLGTPPVGPILGGRPSRRACVRDPEGNWIEVMEADPLGRPVPQRRWPGATATLRSVTISVADLDTAAESWAGGIGLPDAAASLHAPGHEALWGLDGARTRSRTLDAGTALVELVEYETPVGRPPPAGRRLCDQGIMNVAFVARDRATFEATFDRWVRLGFKPTSAAPLEAGVFRVMYFDLPSGENVELLYPRRAAWRLTGFVPTRAIRRKRRPGARAPRGSGPHRRWSRAGGRPGGRARPARSP